jgi:hypothetical protein
MTATFRTDVIKLEALGFLPECWVVQHWCRPCRQKVETAELLAHAKAHDAGQLPEPGSSRTDPEAVPGDSPCSTESNRKGA